MRGLVYVCSRHKKFKLDWIRNYRETTTSGLIFPLILWGLNVVMEIKADMDVDRRNSIEVIIVQSLKDRTETLGVGM